MAEYDTAGGVPAPSAADSSSQDADRTASRRRISHLAWDALRRCSVETPLADYLELLCLLRRATADLEKGWPEAAYDALVRALRLAQAAEDVTGTHRIACQLMDDGLSEGEVAAILGWDIDQVRRAVADRWGEWNGRPC